MSTKVLCVDDDPNILAAYQRNLRKHYAIDTALGGEEGLARIAAQGPYAVVVADMKMPGMDGVQFLTRVEDKAPDTVRIMLTGNADQQTAVEAVNRGHVYRFLNKPCPPEMLALALDAGLAQYRHVRAERELLEGTLNGSIQVLMEILSVVDPRSFGRGQALRDHMRLFLKSLGAQPSWECEIAAMLSQIGYVTLPPDVLQKARDGRGLNAIEKNLLLRMPQTGSDLLAKIPRLDGVAQILLYQTKAFDGSGFPLDGLAGEELPVGARILKVLADLQDLEVKGQSRGTALVQLQTRTGQYDPRVLDAAFKCFDAYLPESSTVKGPARSLRLADLRPGQVLASNVETKEGMLIVPAGNSLTPVTLEKIRNFAALNGIKEPVIVEG